MALLNAKPSVIDVLDTFLGLKTESQKHWRKSARQGKCN